MINTIWWDRSRGSWDSGLLCEIFEKHPESFNVINQKEPYYTDKAIVIICGNPGIAPLRTYLETLKSGLVILTSEEEGTFDWKKAIPPHLEIMTQYFQPKTKSEIKERILLGVPNRFKNYKINTQVQKKYWWSYIGQVQNEFRQKCVDVLKTMPNGFLHIAEGFGGQQNGIEYQQYLDICCQSRFVICPAGNVNVDTFRVYEALECDAIPITEKRHPLNHKSFDYWEEVYPSHGLITIEDWEELPEQINKYYPVSLPHWWFRYKEELEQKLLDYAKH